MSASAASDAPAGPAFPDQTPCRSCNRDINFPCGIWRPTNCPNCTGRIVPHHICDGQGLNQTLLDRDIRADCNGCVGTGNMMLCRHCDGRTTVRDGRRRVPCDGCGARATLRCAVCQADGTVWIFIRFCVGDRPGQDGRRHPVSREFPRNVWSRVEEADVAAQDMQMPE